MRGPVTRAAVLLCGILAACEPPVPFAGVSGHPGKKGVDGGLDGGAPPPPGPVQLTVTVEGNGRVYSRYFECSSSCVVPVPAGVPFEVQADAASGFALAGWEGACGGAVGCRVEIGEDARLGATFAPANPP
jgi:hypothetical protein